MPNTFRNRLMVAWQACVGNTRNGADASIQRDRAAHVSDISEGTLTRERLGPRIVRNHDRSSELKPAVPHSPLVALCRESPEDRARFRISLVGAVALHLLLCLV